VDLDHLYNRALNAIGADIGNDHEFVLEDNGFEAVRGLTTRYLFPIQRAVSVHKKGGAKILLQGTYTHTPMGGQSPVPNNFSITDSSSSSHSTLQSSDAVVLGGDSPLMVGDVVVTTARDLGALDEGLIGCKVLLNMTIKIGDYYLKRNVVQSSEPAVNIHRTTQADLDYHDLVQDGAVEWTTTESTYTIVCPHVGMGNPEPDVILQGDNDEIQRVAGFHIKIRDNENEFKFRQTAGDTKDGLHAQFSIDWTLPALPDTIAEHVGALFKCQVEYKSRLNATISPSSHSSISNQNGYVGRIGNFRIFNTADAGEADVTFVADHTKNRAIVKVADTILGDAYTGTDSLGALRHWNFSSEQWVRTGSSGQTWGTTDDTDPGLFLHELLALRGLQERKTFVPQVSGTFVFNPAAKSYDAATAEARAENKLPALHQLIRYDVGVDGRKYFFQSATWTAKSTSFDFAGFIVDVDRNFVPNTTDDDQISVPDFGGFGGGGLGPNEDATNGGGFANDLQVIKGEISSGGSGTGLTDEQIDKLDAITLNASGQISALTSDPTRGDILSADQIDDSTSTSNKFATPAQISAIGNNTTQVNGLKVRMTTAENDIDALEIDFADLELSIDRLLDLIKDTGGDKGIYATTTKLLTNARVTIADKSAQLFAGSNTGVSVTESSPGTIRLNVQAGATGSEVEVTAISIVGSPTLQNASILITQPVTFSSSTSGITTTNVIEGSKLFHTNARVDARIAAASVTDLSDVTSVGSGEIMTSAERTKLAAIEAGATNSTSLADGDQTLTDNRLIDSDGNDLDLDIGTAEFTIKNGATTIATFSHQGGISGEFPTLAKADQVLEADRTIYFDGNDLLFKTGDGSGSSITELHYDAFGAQGTGIFRFGARVEFQDVVDFRGSGGTTQSQIRLREPVMGGTSAVVLKGPSTNLSSDVIFVLPDSDGSAGQFLKTDGSGNLSFASASGGGSANSYVLLSSSTRVPLYWGQRYYWGSTSYGWNTDSAFSYATTSATSIVDDYAHLGVVAPTDISTLKIFATLRNDTSSDDVEVYVYKGSRPNGSSSSITLTELIDVSVSMTQDLHHNADGTKTSAGISAGDLIFVAFRRTTTTNATQYLNASWTLHATE
jgi:hypothetical protein